MAACSEMHLQLYLAKPKNQNEWSSFGRMLAIIVRPYVFCEDNGSLVFVVSLHEGLLYLLELKSTGFNAIKNFFSVLSNDRPIPRWQ